ncbi:MAG: hypothetical protein IJ094_00995 [Bacilli bacterium]|nr:hypothetical protein [Bacilli bacterium]
MRYLRRIFSTAIVISIVITNLGFVQEKTEKLIPSDDVIFVNMELNYPILQMILNKHTELEVDDVILEVNRYILCSLRESNYI